MRIEAYFQQIRTTVDACPFLHLSALTFDKRGTYEGFIRGELDLNLPTYPHHKHDGSEDDVVASAAPDLETVLSEIGRLVRLS